ncbi:Mitochondrial import receptor subunit TOM20-like protein [Heterocephalus glaber]|uniref:Mitochondrial import receptor subunit TOM20 homolog n=1 Tax=Heterocephalus glaber TaxID=10181 RepID=G5AT92_HETGA|nr:Mitochondrial import receptor subunit TOM20-like protein [Heterocephalus glaber]
MQVCGLELLCESAAVPHAEFERTWWVGTALSRPGSAGALFTGYCIYFDQRGEVIPTSGTGILNEERNRNLPEEAGLSKLPDLKDDEAVQKFFLEEIQLGEALLAQGEYEKGVDHLTNAAAVCGQPQQFLQVLQQTLPPPVLQMVLTKLSTIREL